MKRWVLTFVSLIQTVNVQFLLSTLEHFVLRVSYCDRSLPSSVIVRRASSVVSSPLCVFLFT